MQEKETCPRVLLAGDALDRFAIKNKSRSRIVTVPVSMAWALEIIVLTPTFSL